MRIAIASTGKTKDVAQYLPNNFTVLGRTLDARGTIIVGVDDHGWSLDAYVIPRLGSALIACKEVIEINGLTITQLELNLTAAQKAETQSKGGIMKTLRLDQTVNTNWVINPDNVDDPDRYRYKVTKVTNSSTPKIWDLLTQEQIDVYCEDDGWEVTIS